MSDQLTMFPQQSLPNIPSAISSPELESGPMPCGSPDGPMIDPCGLEAAPALHSAPRVNGKAKRINAIYGRLGFDSSPSHALATCLQNRLRPVTDLLGSTMFTLTWKERVTPSGRLIFAQRALAPRIFGSGYTSGPTPQSSDGSGGGQAKRAANPKRSNDLNDFAMLAPWPTPNCPNGGRVQSDETT